MTAPENTRERLAEAIWNASRAVEATKEVAGQYADALLSLIDTLLQEQSEGIAAAIENERDNPVRGWNDYSPSDVRETSVALLTGMREGMTTAASVARTFGGER